MHQLGPAARRIPSHRAGESPRGVDLGNPSTGDAEIVEIPGWVLKLRRKDDLMLAPALVQIAAVSSASLIGLVIVFQVALATGAHWGSAAYGGRFVEGAGQLPTRYRATSAVAAIALSGVAPTRETVLAFQTSLSEATGLAFGIVSSACDEVRDVSQILQETTSRESGFHAVARNAVLEMHEVRRWRPELVSHYYANFIGPPDAMVADLLELGEPTLAYKPLLRCDSGQYLWSEARLDIDTATDLLEGIVVAGALDDIIGGTGALTADHLPTAEFSGQDSARYFSHLVQQRTGVSLPFAIAEP